MTESEFCGSLDMIRNYATFESAFPDDCEENDSGETMPAGRALAVALACNITSAGNPHQHGFYGWRFEFECANGRTAWALVQQPGPWLLIVEGKVGWLESRDKKTATIEEAVLLVESGLKMVREVSAVTWLTQDEFIKSQPRK
jgi:hypothetical protein